MIVAFDNKSKLLDVMALCACPQKKLDFAFEFAPDPAWLNLTPYQWKGDGLAKLEAKAEGEGVTLSGQITIPTEFVCSKCGESFEQNLFIEVNETLTESQDDEHFKIVADKVDLAQMVSELVALNIPTKVLCRPNCLGVCPNCGTNLNESTCDCEKKLESNNPFAKLKGKFN